MAATQILKSSTTTKTSHLHQQTATATTTTTTSKPISFSACSMNILSEVWPKMDRLKAETLLRIGLSALACYILAIASVPKIIPPSQRVTIGILGSVLPMVLPKLLFGIAGAVPSMIGMIIIASLGGTALLAAATVSDAVYVIVFTLYTLAFTTLYFGSKFEKTSGSATVCIALAALIALSIQPLVQDGFSVSKDSPVPEEVKTRVWTALCRLLEPNDPNCVDNVNSYSWSSGPVKLPNDTGNALAGRTAYLSISNGQVTLDIPGGLWIVKALWTESGLDNNLAIFRNLLIVLCWGGACYIVLAVLLPFARSARQLISQVVIPSTIQRVYTLIQQKRGEEDAPAKKTRGELIHLWNVYSRKISAGMILFEPRLVKAPFEYIVPDLQNLLDEVRDLLVAGMYYDAYSPEPGSNDLTPTNSMDQYVGLLQLSIQALKTYSDDDVQALKTQLEALPPQSKVIWAHAEYLQRHCQKVAQATLDWIHALDTRNKPRTPSKDVPEHLSKMYLPWVLAPVMALIRLFSAFVIIPLHPKRWNIQAVLWSCKLTAGYVALFCMTVYWPAFTNFRLEITGDQLGGVYHGWHLLGYAFASMPTLEGTVKKSFSRVFGTCTGGFLAWLGVIVCSGSYDDDADINPYGLIAWLTVFTVFASHFYVESGFGSLMGISADDGYNGMYMSMSLVLVAMEVYTGAGSKGDISVNRIVATITGVIMATVVAMIPPYVLGGDPIHARQYLDSLKRAIGALVWIVADKHQSLDKDDFHKQYLEKAQLKGREAFFLHDDAARLHRFPIFRVDEGLLPVIEELAITESLIVQLVEFFENALSEGTIDEEELARAASALLSPPDDVEDGRESSPVKIDDEDHGADLFTVLVVRGRASLKKQEEILDKMIETHPFLSYLEARV